MFSECVVSLLFEEKTFAIISKFGGGGDECVLELNKNSLKF
jgi:hypothetical protein